MTAPTIDTEVVDRVRQVLAEAEAEGRPRPGRPTLARLTGASEHQVRQVLMVLGDQPGEPGDDLVSPGEPASPAGENRAPAPASVTPSAAPDRQPGEPLVTQPASLAPAGDDLAPALASAPASAHLPRQWPLIVIGLAAAVAVWGGWVELGRFTGFGVVQPLPGVWDDLRINTAIVLPLGIEAYGGYALRTWLSSAVLSVRTRSFARWSAIASLVVGAGAQVASHLMKAASVTTAPPLVTVLVACVPVLVLGLATGLATLVKRDASPGEEA